MTQITKFKDRLVASDPPVSFDFGMFAPFLIDAMVKLLSGCGQDGFSRAKQILRDPNSEEGWKLVRKATLRAKRESGVAFARYDSGIIAQHFMETCRASSDRQLNQLLGETEAVATYIQTFL